MIGTTTRTMALRQAASLLELCSLVKVDIEKGEVTNISVDNIDIGDPSVEDLSWTLTQNLQGEELLQMADKALKVLGDFNIFWEGMGTTTNWEL
ncbi:hypothetical protein Tco_0880943 [Tanacetum coccineum]